MNIVDMLDSSMFFCVFILSALSGIKFILFGLIKILEKNIENKSIK